MKHLLLIIFLIFQTLLGCTQKQEKPNILFIIADDISRNSYGVYGCKYIKTPGFDKIANEGVLFTNAYTNNPKCAPSRAMLLTGRYSWQLKEACNHNPFMPEEWVFYPDILEENGYFMGFTGKGWSPGTYFGEHNPAGWEYNDLKHEPPYKFINKKDYVANFKAFLNKNSENKPFCFWFGTHEAHRGFERDVHLKGGIDPKKVMVQNCFPDNDLVRRDLADYGVEVEYHDQQIQHCIEILEGRGQLNNTLIIATSDHGMAFPHIKGQIYDEAFHVPFAVRWGNKIKPGRIVEDYISFPDIAPTLLEVAGLKPHSQMTGKSFLDLLLSNKSGKINPERSHVLLGKERHDVGRTDGEQLTVGYPVRAIRNDQYLYVKNFKPNRWPVGDPEYNYLNCDDSPTKSYLLEQEPSSQDYPYFLMSFGKRAGEELYNIVNDPDCIKNLAKDPDYKKIKTDLNKQMTEELRLQKDPRILGNGDIFDYYPHANTEKLKSLYGDKYIDMKKQFNERYNITNN